MFGVRRVPRVVLLGNSHSGVLEGGHLRGLRAEVSPKEKSGGELGRGLGAGDAQVHGKHEETAVGEEPVDEQDQAGERPVPGAECESSGCLGQGEEQQQGADQEQRQDLQLLLQTD